MTIDEVLEKGKKIGYNKGIDDFVKLAEEYYYEYDNNDITENVMGFIKFLAEQLKEI